MTEVKRRRSDICATAEMSSALLIDGAFTTSPALTPPFIDCPSTASTTFIPSTASLPSPLLASPAVAETSISEFAGCLKWQRCQRILPLPLFQILRFFNKIFFVDETKAKKVPLLRGKIHLLLVYLSPLWIACLFRCCGSKTAVFAACLSSIASLFNFTASALLHNCSWSNMTFQLITKLDYVGIFLMISGSCSPIPILLLKSTRRLLLLLAQWSGAILGVALTLFGQYTDDKHSARAVVYCVVGLSNALFFKWFLDCLTIFEFILLGLMATFYVTGAVFYARKSPNLWPGVFGYHELFHFFCLLGGICTFVVNQSVLSRGTLQLADY